MNHPKRSDRLTVITFTVSPVLGEKYANAVWFSNIELPPLFHATNRFVSAALLILQVILKCKQLYQYLLGRNLDKKFILITNL